jgi:hypothetical protein
MHFRDEKWAESLAVGSEAFVRATKEQLGFKARGREVIGREGSYELRESAAPYEGILGHENAVLRPQNEYVSKILIEYRPDGLVRPATEQLFGGLSWNSG